MIHVVYILYSEKSDSYYIGHTKNLDDRITRHNAGRSKYTKRGIPWKLVYSEKCSSKSEAIKRELFLKRQKSKQFIQKLIGKH